MADSDASPAYTFQILGPLEIRRDGEPVPLPTAPRVLRLLAVLLLNAPNFVSI
ncbi:hypothetical protein OWR29_36760 [Actinoplanes sp. Pm04-4]|uniref:Uncharacterized protein n=1 Tax=Paractinoplanes pyxinae TaxID=2997416 RepID=A0ABT4BAN4_9ACTN|nr:hypothetical protein [Actinoplanes pyxinae]MCY1143584.1 hypothetical protein [Actinoplanes pyxinae]